MKHRNLRRAAGLLLAAALVIGTLCGCSGKGSGETTDGGGDGTGSGSSQGNQTQEAGGQAMGRFLEEAVDTGIAFANIYDMEKLEDGSIRLVGVDGDTEKDGVWESKDDGRTWNKVFDFPAEVLTNHDKGYVNHAALSPGGQIVCVFNEIVADGVHQDLYLLDKEGKASKIPFEVPEAEDDDQTAGFAITNLITNLQFPSDEWVLLADSALETVYQVSVPDGSLKHTYETNMGLGPMPMHSAGNTLILQDESQALLYDLQTGERKDPEEALNKGSNENGRFSVVDTMDRGESIYSISPGGLCHYKFGGSVMERLIDGSTNSLGSPTFYPIALTMLDEQNFLVAAEDADTETGIALLRYTYSADTLAKPDKELKVYSLYDNKEIRQSVIQFQKEHTDVYVNYQAGFAEDSGMMVSDTLKTLTTEIMAGNGPDVLMLDGMPVETYIEKGILKDLAALLKESGGSYFENITSAYQDGQGQVCAVPARFKIPMIQAEGAYYTQDEDFDAFTARKDTMVNMYPKTVVEKFWLTCGAAWRKDDKTLDEAKITEFLTKLKNAYGEYDSSLDEESTIEYPSTTNLDEVVSKLSMGSGDFDLVFGRCHTNFGLRESMDYGMQNAVDKKLEDGIIGLMPGQADRVFVPSMILGISNKAAQPEAADEFIKYMFSKEAQKLSRSSGFPVEKEAFRNAIDGHEYAGKDESVAIGGVRGEIIDFDREPTPEKEIAKMTEIAESLITPAFQDDVIKHAVIEQGTKVLKGEISPEEATAAIIKKVNIYLAE